MTPKRKAIQFAIVNLIHCRLSPTQPFSERLPTFELPILWLSTLRLPIFNENSTEILLY
ncbi:MAG: hypothetical protein LBK82_01295 [Planctomycetaceae bacterium]|nr:hypothetical protein [Planctomycetaceae bacterium]